MKTKAYTIQIPFEQGDCLHIEVDCAEKAAQSELQKVQHQLSEAQAALAVVHQTIESLMATEVMLERIVNAEPHTR